MSGIYNTSKGVEKKTQLGQSKDDIPYEKYGKNSVVTTSSTPEAIWNGGDEYTGHPTTGAETMEIFSSSDNDTASGTGARTVRISKLLDEDGNQMPDIEVSLNGETPVSLGVLEYWRGGVRIKVLTAGSLGKNEGTITLRHTTTTTNIFAVMPIGRNQTSILADTVPKGMTLRIKVGFQLSRTSGAPGSADVTLRARPYGGVFNTPVSAEVTTSQNWESLNGMYYEFEELTDLVGVVESVSDNASQLTGQWVGYYIEN